MCVIIKCKLMLSYTSHIPRNLSGHDSEGLIGCCGPAVNQCKNNRLQSLCILNITYLNIRRRFLVLLTELRQPSVETTNAEHTSSQHSFRNNESFIYNFKVHLVNKYIFCTHLQSKQCLSYNNRSGYSNSGSDRIDRIFTPIKEFYKSSSALGAHSQHIIINIHKHFKR